MANKIIMEFKKGDKVTHFFKLPLADYSTGGKLFFAAKPIPDNDATDAAAVIDKTFEDDVVETDDDFAEWTLDFDPGDITNVSFSNGEKKKTYSGEFQFVDAGGDPKSFPADDGFIEVIIYADIKRAVA